MVMGLVGEEGVEWGLEAVLLHAEAARRCIERLHQVVDVVFAVRRRLRSRRRMSSLLRLRTAHEYSSISKEHWSFNPLMGTLKPQRSGTDPLYNNTVIGTLAVNGWAVTFSIARRGRAGTRPGPSSLYQI